jgi:hypothetical protein
MMICELCGKEFSEKYGSGRFCGSHCARSFSTSKDRDSINRKISMSLKSSVWGNNYFKKRSVEKRTLYDKEPILCDFCKHPLPFEKRDQKYCSLECFRKDPNSRNSGGYRKGSGRGIGGFYKGFYCDSTYELVYLVYSLDNGVKIERNTKKYPYTFKGKQHNYIPDFEVGDKYVETKGYHTDLVDVKKASVDDKEVQVLYRKDLQHCFDHIYKVYGIKESNVLSLYDNHKPVYTYTCDGCKEKFETDQKRRHVIKYCSNTCAGKYHTGRTPQLAG